MKVLCFGSLNIDYTFSVDHFVGKGETLSSEQLDVYPGGKGLNQSIALAKAGADVYHAGAIGEDGKFLLTAMGKPGVDTSLVSVIEDARTGNAIIQRDIEGDNCIILFGGANQMITEAHVDRVISNFSTGDYLVLQNEINLLPYIIRRAHENGMKIILNPSPMNAKIMELPLECVDIFILNEIEADQILGYVESGQTNLTDILQTRFPKAAILLTLGGNGSHYLDKGFRHFQKAYPIPIVDSTAAGDTFTGFFIGGLLKGKTIPESMNDASIAAAISCSRAGAAPSIPTVVEVETFLFKLV